MTYRHTQQLELTEKNLSWTLQIIYFRAFSFFTKSCNVWKHNLFWNRSKQTLRYFDRSTNSHALKKQYFSQDFRFLTSEVNALTILNFSNFFTELFTYCQTNKFETRQDDKHTIDDGGVNWIWSDKNHLRWQNCIIIIYYSQLCEWIR